VKRFLRDNGLSVFFLVIFALALAGQALAGHAEYNQEQAAHARLLHEQAETLSLWQYLSTSEFGQAVMENWQSEYLQFVLFILATIWFVQRGSTESKRVGDSGTESDESQRLGAHAGPDSPRWARAGGWRLAVYSNSLVLVMALIWIGSWAAQSITGWGAYNAQQLEHREIAVSWWAYVESASFWQDTLQNWQSEFLAVGSVIVFTVYLRQRGSAQSKPVGAAHGETAVEG
jgi:hypothetical protein